MTSPKTDDGTMHLLDPAPFGRILPAMVTPHEGRRSRRFRSRATAGEAARGGWCRRSCGQRHHRRISDHPHGGEGRAGSGRQGSRGRAGHFRRRFQRHRAHRAHGGADPGGGRDAVLVVAPYYSRPSQEGVFRHYKAVNDSADKPIIIYDVPGRTGLHIQLETTAVWPSSTTSRPSRTPPETSPARYASVWKPA